MLQPIDHLVGVAVLPGLAVDLRPQTQLLRIGDLVAGHEPGTEGREGVAGLALRPLAGAPELEVALAHVVADAVAGDVVEGVGLVHVLARHADDGGEFDLVVGPFGTPGNDDRIVGAADRARGFHEQHRLRRHFETRLRRVIGIVEADGHDLADAGHGRSQSRVSADLEQRGGVKRRQPRDALREQDVAGDVIDLPGEIAEAAVRIDEAGFLPPRGTVANQFDH